MHPIKYVWACRVFFYKLFFGKIGKFTYIGKPVFMEGCRNIFIGNNVRIFPGLRIQTLDDGKIFIGNNVAIEQNVHIISGCSELKIEKDCVISANVLITNHSHSYEKIDLSVLEQPNLYDKTYVGESCFIGFGACILAGTKLGRHCIVGANSVVKGVFPDYCVITGIPGKITKIYDKKMKKWIKYKNNSSI